MTTTIIKITKSDLPGEMVGECQCCGTPITKAFTMSDGRVLGQKCAYGEQAATRAIQAHQRNEADLRRAQYLADMAREARSMR